MIYHGCGNVDAIFPDYIETGIDGYNPLEVKAGMDVLDLRRRYGHQMAFCGNSDIQVWETGDREAIRREVLRKLNAARGGGLIFQSDHSVSSSVLGPHVRLHRQAGPRVRRVSAAARRVRRMSLSRHSDIDLPDPSQSDCLGVVLARRGAFLSANCYAPQRYIKRWSWEIFWMTQAAVVLAALAHHHRHLHDPQPGASAAPSRPSCRCSSALLMGVAYGVGGTAFNISIRYIGFSLTYSIAVGLSSVLGTLVTPLGKAASARFSPSRAAAGSSRASPWARSASRCAAPPAGSRNATSASNRAAPASFRWIKGLLLSLLAGVLSAVYGIAINDVAKPIIATAEQLGAGYWKGNIGYLFVNPGAS